MSDSKTEQDMRAAFEAIYPRLSCASSNHSLAWAAYRCGRLDERQCLDSPTANPGVETDSPDTKCQQGAGG